MVDSGGTAMSVFNGAFVLSKTGYSDGLNDTMFCNTFSSLREKLPESMAL